MQAVIFVNFKAGGLITIKTYRNVVNCMLPITPWSLMDNLSGEQFAPASQILRAKLANRLYFMIGITSIPNTSTFIAYSRDDDRPVLKNEGSIATQYDKFNSDPSINAIPF